MCFISDMLQAPGEECTIPKDLNNVPTDAKANDISLSTPIDEATFQDIKRKV